MPTLLEMQKIMLDQVVAGDFLTGMREYYAEDVVNEESTGATTNGRDTLISNEEKFLETVETYHGCDVKSYGVGEDDGNGNGVTFAEYAIRADLKDGSTFNPTQVQVTRWKNGKVVRNTFYYDPAKL